MRRIARLIGIILTICSTAVSAEELLPAFPGAEGAGAVSLGGRGGRAVFVTNLNDDGPGSIRAACALAEPRTVIFRVSGVIDLKKSIAIKSGRLTIAGQTAPGGGICLRGGDLSVEADDVVIRYLRIRPGDVLNEEVDGLCVSGSHRVVIDHCSVSWSVDEVLSVVGVSDNISVQWCMITEALHHSVHKKGAHGMGSLLRSKGGTYSFHHCLYAHNNTRNPRPGDNYDGSQGVLLDFRNNVIYNWGGSCGYGMKEQYRLNYIGNYLKAGPSTKSVDRQLVFHIGGPGNHVYFQGNVLEGLPEADADNARIVEFPKNLTTAERTAVWGTAPFPTPTIKTSAAKEACAKVLAGVGATLPKRDRIDARIVSEVRMGGGRIIDSQKEVGGWPTYRSKKPPTDSDNDGMPDSWEKKHGLNPQSADDAAQLAVQGAHGNGYTNLEEYLNSLVPSPCLM